MRGYRAYHHYSDPECVSRPVRVPTEREAREALARDCARTPQGADLWKAAAMRQTGLFEVALDGMEGMHREWRRAREGRSA